MKCEIILREPRNVDFAIAQIRAVDLNELHVVKIKPVTETRSDLQNKLYWVWVGVIGDAVGMTNDEFHFQSKARYLLPILLRDEHDETVDMYSAIKTVFDAGMVEQAKTAKRHMLRHMLSTTWLTVKQMAEYLREIEGYARDGGIMLPCPDDYKYIMNEQRTR